MTNHTTPPETPIEHKIHQETSKIAWKDLQTFFAKGIIIDVSSELDLINVAKQMTEDNVTQIQQWTTDGKMQPVSDAQAHKWTSLETTLWAVVVKPWVLVQEITSSDKQNTADEI